MQHSNENSISTNGQQAAKQSAETSEKQQLLKALRESELLRELAELLASSLDPTRILQVLVRRTTEVCEVSRCAIWLLEDSQDQSQSQSQKSPSAYPAKPTRLRFLPTAYHMTMQNMHQRIFQMADRMWHHSLIDFDNPIIGRLLDEQGLLIVDELREQPGLQMLADKFYARSIMLVALIREGRPVGMLSLDNPGQQTTFTHDQSQLARAIGQQAAVAIDNARLLTEARNAVALSNERANTLNAIYNAMTEGLVVLDSNGRAILSNQTADRMLKLNASTNHDLSSFLSNRSIFTLTGEPIQPNDSPFVRALRGEQIHGERFLSKDAEDNEAAIEINIVPMLDSENRKIGIVSAFRDITEQVRIEQRLRLALLTMLHAAEAVSGVLEIDEILKRILSMSLNTVSSERGIMQIFDEETQTLTPLASAGFTEQEIAEWPTEYSRQLVGSLNQSQLKEGRAILINNELSLINTDEISHRMVLAVPITHQYHLLGLMLLDRSVIHRQASPEQADNGTTTRATQPLSAIEFNAWDIAIIEGIAQFAGMAIEEARLQQEAKIARLNEAIMRESNAQKDEILAITAHEFRTPLTVILAHSQMMTRILNRAQEANPQLKERLLESNAFIADQTRQLTNIVNTFLEVTRLNRRQINLDLEEINVADLIIEIISNHRATSPIHTISYQFDPATQPYLIKGDRARLVQIFANLLQNAIKYSPLGGPITFTLTRLTRLIPIETLPQTGDEESTTGAIGTIQREEQVVEVSIIDSGIGVPLEDQVHLFECFYRASNIGASQAKGVGLGLFVVAEFLQLHGGTIRVESSGIAGEGSRFILTLPLVSADTELS